MREDYYKTDYPDFSDRLDLLETTDPAHADLFNKINKKLFDNTLYLRKQLDAIKDEQAIENAFYAVFGSVTHDTTAMTPFDVDTAINTPWDGSSSADPTAMSATDVDTAISTPWDGSSSTDPTAMSATDVEDALR